MEHMLRGRTDAKKVKLLLALMARQNMHINFLSENLAHSFNPGTVDGLSLSSDLANVFDSELVSVV